MKMKMMKLCTALTLLCTYFLMPVRAQEEISVAFVANDQENQATLSIAGLQDANAFSLHLKLSDEVKLESMEPSQELTTQGARVNYVYEEATQTLDIYVTSKKNLTYTDALPIGTMHVSGKDGTQVSVALNEDKDGLKTVSSYSSTIQKPVMEVTPFPIKVSKEDVDDEHKGDKEEPIVKEVNIKDEATGVSILAAAGVLPEGTTAKISVVADETVLQQVSEKLKEQSTKFVLYDISLWNKEERIQPKEGSTVSVRLPIPSGYDKDKLAVFGVDGDLEIFNISIDGKDVVFETSHFSKYVLAEKNAETIPVDPEITTDEAKGNGGVATGDSTNMAAFMALFAVSAIVVFTGYRKYCK